MITGSSGKKFLKNCKKFIKIKIFLEEKDFGFKKFSKT